MATNLTRFKEELDGLIALGTEMSFDLRASKPNATIKLKTEHKAALDSIKGSFEKNYQRWYTEAAAVVRQLTPHRAPEFEAYYRTDPKRKDVGYTTYSIQDWMMGLRATTNYSGEKAFDDHSTVVMRFNTQLEILRSAAARFESSLMDIKQVVQADLFDSELGAASELVKKGFLRAAGVISGVVLERHLAQTIANHQITSRKKHATIGDYNELLKADGTIDIPVWRFIQRLGDLRNLSAHHGDREPTKEEVAELVSGVERITKTVF